MIRLDHVCVRRGAQPVLRDISLAFDGPEFIAVLGPNGAGKTTLLRAILGLEPVASGRLTVNGAPATRGNRAIGYMPQTRTTAPAARITGFDVLANAATGYHLGLPLVSAALRAEILALLEELDAADLATRPLQKMSGGQRQRLLLAGALLGNPKILLLDEPLISLDLRAQSAMIALIARLRRERDLLVLFAAHDINPLLGSVERVLYLSNGNAALGTVDEVITDRNLSRLYGAPVEIIRAAGRIFVLSDRPDAHGECGECGHNHDHQP